MRPGLVAVGVAFVVVAVASAAAMYLLPPAPVDHQVSTEIPSLVTPPNQTEQALLYGTNTSDGSFVLSWQSSGPVSAQLYHTLGCSAPVSGCGRSGMAASWDRVTSGQYSEAGRLSYPYLIVWVGPEKASVSFQAHAISHAVSRPGWPTLAVLLSEATAVALGVVGAVALFLGLFLRPGVYRASAPLVSQGAEDAEAVAAGDGPRPVTDPRTGPSDGGSGPPRPGPPARGR